jgi:hypothetical protein
MARSPINLELSLTAILDSRFMFFSRDVIKVSLFVELLCWRNCVVCCYTVAILFAGVVLISPCAAIAK